VGLRINQNTAAANAYRNLNVSDGQMAKSLEKLSSGFRINRAADDAAGLSISEGMRSQIGGLKVAVRNAQDGISVVQTAEGALTEVHSLLQRARDLSVQSANTGGNDAAARTAASTEVDQIVNEVNRISASTAFGGKNLLDGSQTAGFTFQVGSGTATTDKVTVNIASMSAAGLGLTGTGATAAAGTLAGAPVIAGPGTVSITYNTGAGANVASSFNVAAGTYDTTTASGRDTLQAALNTGLQSAGLSNDLKAEIVGAGGGTYAVKLSTLGTGATASISVTGGTSIGAGGLNLTGGTQLGSGAGSVGAQVAAGSTSAIATLDTAIGQVSTQRAQLGAVQNRFEHTIANLNVTVENLSASESRIRDTDMAMEMTAYSRTQILTQAGTAMLAQANQSQQGVLQLLRG
jgi:flagellin-like hook-associated protein FlgL